MNSKKSFLAIGLNLLAIIGVGALLGWLAMAMLGVWTGHGKEVSVPDVRGLYYDEAYELLRSGGFEVELSDSVYDKRSRPGAVVDQNPHMGAIVKPGRMIYLTINAFSPKMVTLPRLADISARQARAILEGLGVTNVEEQPVASEFEGLVIDALYKGSSLQPGARVPVNARIVLEVGQTSDGTDSTAINADDDRIDRLDLF